MLKRVWHFLHLYRYEEILLLVMAVFLVVQHLEWFLSLIVVVSYVCIVLLINNTFLAKGIKKALKDIQKDYLYFFLLIILIALLVIWQFSLEAIIFLTIFVSFALYGWDSRVTAIGALISLASCPILLITKQDVYAEQMAVYAYYFLVITVVLQIIEYKRHPERFKDDEK